MESELRPHRTKSNSSTSISSTTSELFICFATSRLSSSSMKLSSKSILSPARAARGEPSSQISLSSSLSRRLRTSGSIKGGGQASPMFPTTAPAAGTNKRRGCGFENPEPSSPKVTCIGQVRVKTKKQGKKMRIIARSKRSRGSEGSFRKTEQNQQSTNPSCQELYSRENSYGFQGLNFQNQQECLRQRNQRWVHLPLTICEALRAFGSEFNCLIPNRSSCLASSEENHNNKEKEESKEVGRPENGGGGGGGCGAVFARWFVDLQDGEGKRREIELVVGEEDQERTERFSSTNSSGGGGHSQRRQVFQGIEFKEERLNEGPMEKEEEEEARRVSICVPPKNALLLMRCRSDPVKMAALANRFWEVPAKDEEVEDQEEHNGEECMPHVEPLLCNSEMLTASEGIKEKLDSEEVVEEEDGEEFEEVGNLGFEEKEENGDLDEDPEKRQQLYEEVKEIQGEKGEFQVAEELLEEEEELGLAHQAFSEDCCLLEVDADPESSELDQNGNECEVAEDEQAHIKLPEPFMKSVQLEDEPEEEEKREVEVAAEEKAAEENTEEMTQDRPELDDPVIESDPRSDRAGQNPGLPDCLLLMMCEPKLSMEVSKETWVCTTDFIRCLPERPAKKPDPTMAAKKRVSIDSKPPVAPPQPAIQPPRSSCSFPIQAGPVSMAAMIGQKLVGSAAYEPFVLTRCKSEPMRSANKLAAPPEKCFWKNRKMEPHRRAAMGVGAAGVGF